MYVKLINLKFRYYSHTMSHYSWAKYFQLGLRNVCDYVVSVIDGKQYLFIVSFCKKNVGYRDGKILRTPGRKEKKLIFPEENLQTLELQGHYGYNDNFDLFKLETEGRFANKALILNDDYEWRMTTAKLLYKRKVLGV